MKTIVRFGTLLLLLGLSVFISNCSVSYGQVNQSTTVVETPDIIYQTTPNKTVQVIEETIRPTFSRPIHTSTPTNSPTQESLSSRYGTLAVILTEKRKAGSLENPLPYLCIINSDDAVLKCPRKDLTLYQPLTWSPNGSEFVFSGISELEKTYGMVLHRMDINTGQVSIVDVTYPGNTYFPGNMGDPSWSKEKNQLLFDRTSMTSTEIHLMNSDGAADFLIDGYFPTWIDSSQAVVYLKAEIMDEQMNRLVYHRGKMYRYDFTNQKEIILVEDPIVDSLAASPNGQMIAFSDFSESLYVMNTDGSNKQKILKDSIGAFSWAPDGNSLLYARDCQIHQVTLDGQTSQPFDLPEQFCYWYATKQPDLNSN
jgi:Tol biopolymer transport system component